MILEGENKIFQFFIGKKSKELIKKYILILSILSFIIHLLLIYLAKFELINFNDPYNLLNNPIAAIYTPFSFILIYELYLLIYYLPRSITSYISKQYEIITLIVIRRIFKDISNINLKEDIFNSSYNTQIFIDLGAAVLLFFLIYLFRRNSIKSISTKDEVSLSKFIRVKKWISALLIPTLSIMALYHLFTWTYTTTNYSSQISSINAVFFDELFQLLILVDVLLLIFSFFNSDYFHRIIRNSGFIISTILIRISFMAEGLSNIILIISSLVFGILIQLIYNSYQKKQLF
tara:strand:+ start:2823 stop:3692 length:870 start_codon:yes stop_codon:yes gene_type:complete